MIDKLKAEKKVRNLGIVIFVFLVLNSIILICSIHNLINDFIHSYRIPPKYVENYYSYTIYDRINYIIGVIICLVLLSAFIIFAVSMISKYKLKDNVKLFSILYLSANILFIIRLVYVSIFLEHYHIYSSISDLLSPPCLLITIALLIYNINKSKNSKAVKLSISFIIVLSFVSSIPFNLFIVGIVDAIPLIIYSLVVHTPLFLFLAIYPKE